MVKEIKEFEQEFHNEEFELTVLIHTGINGGVVYGDYIKPSANFIASINEKTGELNETLGRLEWMVKNSDEDDKYGFDLKGMTIYRVRVRKCIEKELKPNVLPLINNLYLLIDVVESDVSDQRLEHIRDLYMTPVYIDDEAGHFKLNRELEWYEGTIDWLEKECSVMLGLDDDKDTAQQSLAVLRRLLADLKNWDNKLRSFAADTLLDAANEYQEDAMGENESTSAEPITKEIFMRRMEIGELYIDGDGSIEVYFNDDDMFWGHTIMVNANISGEIEDSDIVG